LLSLMDKNSVPMICATNCVEALDRAFFRRFNFTVEFRRPDVHLRERLWRALTPERLPLSDDVDFQALAQEFRFTGGEIRNSIERAAAMLLLDRKRGKKLSMNDLRTAAASEIKQQARIGFGAAG
ncbi:MAG: hypothetical protein PHQ23_17660, partial [Candidatus Wallbacteria bacterium]|nr:hypothetical protein [Candidatus Wallbacteria bacterium]